MISSLKPSNMSVPNCNYSQFKQNVTLFNQNVEPKLTALGGYKMSQNPYLMLNPETISKQYDLTYEKVKTCACPTDFGTCCDKETYITNDPRLISVAHNGQYLLLDRPPINGAVNMSDLYTPKFDYHARYYADYSDVDSGQIMYYIDGDIKDPLFTPLYVNPSNVTGYVYKDPMDSYKPYYYREPANKVNVYKTNSNSPDKYNELTWIRDSQESREDLMSKQMDLTNRTKYSSRWF